MHRLRASIRYIRLTALFALCIFLILVFTTLFTLAGTIVLANVGWIPAERVERFPLFLFSIACVVVGTFLALLFSRILLRPIRKIIAATDRVADGDFNVQLDLKGPAEFKSLSSKFNHMTAELRSIELLRSDFVSNFSHEFKTPIVSIRGFAKALKWEHLSEAEREEYLGIIISESERLVSLSTNVLYLSRIESQTILTDKKTFNLSEQIRLVIALLDQRLTDRNLDIEMCGDEVICDGNEEMLRQVWINLLDNAIKFSPEGSTIEVSTYARCRGTAASDGICVQFRDHGCGMTPEQQVHVFDRFYQGDLSHATAGNGLGLSIVKKIVELHGGSIEVQSSEQGSVFTVRLPSADER